MGAHQKPILFTVPSLFPLFRDKGIESRSGTRNRLKSIPLKQALTEKNAAEAHRPTQREKNTSTPYYYLEQGEVGEVRTKPSPFSVAGKSKRGHA